MRSILNALQDGRLFELPEVDKARALEFLARILDANPDIEVGTDAIEEIQRRENACNTGIGAGVGVPHVRARREEGELFCAIGWSVHGIEYGAPDAAKVHLVFMYYIPGAQKNVYLKEISSLVKAIRKTGGIEPIAHAADLNAVRHLLLDWVSAVLGDSGPEAVARMIKLEVKQAQVPPAPAPALALVQPGTAAIAVIQVPALVVVAPPRSFERVLPFQILALPQATPIVLASDPAWCAAAEKEPAWIHRLASSGPAPTPLVVAGREVYVTAVKIYPGGRALYDGVALSSGPAVP